MNTKSFYFSFAVLTLLTVLSGCHVSGEKGRTDWSIPSVKLTRASKDEKVVPPAERASAQATAELAHDRMQGHNPTASIQSGNDPTLRPDPTEIARLHQFEGSNVPGWAEGSNLPPGPEATAPQPAERVAQNVSDSTMSSVAAQSAQTPQTSGALDAAPGVAPLNPSSELTLSAVQTSGGGESLAATVPGTGTGAGAASASIYNGELPDSLDDVAVASAVPATSPAYTNTANPANPANPASSQTIPGVQASGQNAAGVQNPTLAGSGTMGAAGTQGVTHPQAGSTMTEFPDALPGTVPAPVVAGTGTGAGTGLVQASATVPVSQDPMANPAAAPVQPAALFMPGNINPQYPNGPAPVGN